MFHNHQNMRMFELVEDLSNQYTLYSPPEVEVEVVVVEAEEVVGVVLEEEVEVEAE